MTAAGRQSGGAAGYLLEWWPENRISGGDSV